MAFFRDQKCLRMLPQTLLALVAAATTVSAASVAVKQQLTPHLRPLNIVDAIGQGNLPAGIAPPGLPTKQGYYRQTVDHFGNQKGVNGTKFDQLYFVQDAFYKPGGPIFFYIAGESQADDSFITGGAGSLLSWLMPRYNGMAVSLEHRFYGSTPATPGRSTPTADLSPESLKLLTADQSVEDMAEFISNFPSLFPQYKINAAT
ncbi:Thymus-specific serine protease, partial [Rhizoclosmatium hyalinum]